MLKNTTIITSLSVFGLIALLIFFLPNETTTANVTPSEESSSLNLGDFSDNLSIREGVYWMRSEDRVAGGYSLAEVFYQSEQQMLKVEARVKPGFTYPWAGAVLYSQNEIDASQYKRISFDIRGTNGEYRVMAFSGKMGRIPPMQSFGVNDDWQTITFALDQFNGLDPDDFKGLAIVAGPETGSFEYYLDNVKLY